MVDVEILVPAKLPPPPPLIISLKPPNPPKPPKPPVLPNPPPKKSSSSKKLPKPPKPLFLLPVPASLPFPPLSDVFFFLPKPKNSPNLDYWKTNSIMRFHNAITHRRLRMPP